MRVHVPAERALVYRRRRHEPTAGTAHDTRPPRSPARRSTARCCSSCRRRCSWSRCSSIRSSTGCGCRSSRPKGGCARELPQVLHDRQPVADDLDHAEARAAGDADQRRHRAARSRSRCASRRRYQRLITTVLVVPITLGTVLIADGHADLFRAERLARRRCCSSCHLYEGPIRLTHNYWGVLISLVISGFPFAFLLILSYITGIDPVLARAASTLGASPAAQFRHIYLPLLAPGLAMCFCLAFVQAYSVFPSAVLLGAPAGPTRVISHRRVRGGVRAVRLFACLGDRDDHGLRPADHRRGRAGPAQPVLSRAGRRGQGMSDAHDSPGSTARGAACCGAR